MQNTVAAIALLFVALNVHADDWPQYRGPTRSGYTPERVDLSGLTADTPPLWTANAGMGANAPAVVGDRVYVNGYFDEDADLSDGIQDADCAFFSEANKIPQARDYPRPNRPWVCDYSVSTGGPAHFVDEYALCFDLADGKLLWATRIQDQELANEYFYPRATPLVHKGRVFTYSWNGIFSALDAETGKLLWQVDFIDYGQTRAPGHAKGGNWSGPVMGGGSVISLFETHQSSTTIIALDPETGEVNWLTPVPVSAFRGCKTSLTVGMIDGKQTVVQSAGFYTYGFDAATGKQLWAFDYYAHNERVRNRVTWPGRIPVISNGVVIDMSLWSYRHRGSYTFGLRVEEGKVKRIWKVDYPVPMFLPFVVKEGYLYGVDSRGGAKALDLLPGMGSLQCIDVRTGERLWDSKAIDHLINDGDTRHFNPHLMIAGDIPLEPMVGESISSLRPDDDRRLTETMEIPASVPEGEYRLVIQIDSHDDVPKERDEANNELISNGTIQVAAPFVDLNAAVTRLRAADEEYAGEDVTATIRLGNHGNVSADGEVTVTYYLSTDGSLDPGDSTLAAFDDVRVRLSPDRDRTYTHRLNLDKETSTGSYWIIVTVEPNAGMPADPNPLDNVGLAAEPIQVRELIGLHDYTHFDMEGSNWYYDASLSLLERDPSNRNPAPTTWNGTFSYHVSSLFSGQPKRTEVTARVDGVDTITLELEFDEEQTTAVGRINSTSLGELALDIDYEQVTPSLFKPESGTRWKARVPVDAVTTIDTGFYGRMEVDLSGTATMTTRLLGFEDQLLLNNGRSYADVLHWEQDLVFSGRAIVTLLDWGERGSVRVSITDDMELWADKDAGIVRMAGHSKTRVSAGGDFLETIQDMEAELRV